MESKKTSQRDDPEAIKQDLAELEWYIDEFSTFLPLAVCTLSHLGIIISINKAFEKLTGYDAMSIVREPLDSIFLDKEQYNKTIENAKIAETSQEDLVIICKDGKQISVSASVGGRKDKDGTFIGFYVSLTDIGELKKLQSDLEKKVDERTKELQEKLEDLEKFAKLTIGRELKMVELKNKIKEIEEEKK
jgi:PAS domain S-box-containing protein